MKVEMEDILVDIEFMKDKIKTSDIGIIFDFMNKGDFDKIFCRAKRVVEKLERIENEF